MSFRKRRAVDYEDDFLAEKMDMEEPLLYILEKFYGGISEEKDYEKYGWTEKNLYQWTNDDVFDWLFSTINSYQDAPQNTFGTLLSSTSCSSLKAENFQRLTGSDLARMSEREFIEKDETYGQLLYASLQALKIEAVNSNAAYCPNSAPGLPSICSFKKEIPFSPPYGPEVYSAQYNHCSEYSPVPSINDSPTYQLLNNINCDGLEALGGLDDFSIDFSTSTMHEVNRFNFLDIDELLGFSNEKNSASPTTSPSQKNANDQSLESNISKKAYKVQKRKPAEVKNEYFADDVGTREVPKIPLTEQNEQPDAVEFPVAKKSRSTHLWKFMKNLLDDPTYNPDCIRWEDQKLGVFRIVPGQSKLIARLWGIKKNNPTMNFDKLSRSLRWCREYGFLSPVPKDRGFPKKLCFRFGNKALI